MLVLQEIFGVGPYIRSVAERLAGAGYVVGAPDVFWRFAPGGRPATTKRGLAASMEQVGNLDPAARRRLRGRARPPRRAAESTAGPGVLGFCLGGTLALGVAAADARRLRQLLRLRRPGHARPARRGRLPDAVPLRRRRRLHPGRGRRGTGRRHRRPARVSCSTSRPPATRSTTTSRRCSTTRLRPGRLVQDDGVPRRAPPASGAPCRQRRPREGAAATSAAANSSGRRLVNRRVRVGRRAGARPRCS